MEITEGLRQIDMVENPANTPAGNSYLTPEKLAQIKAMSEEAFSQLQSGMAEALSNGNINQADVEAVMWARTGDATLPAGISSIPDISGPEQAPGPVGKQEGFITRWTRPEVAAQLPPPTEDLGDATKGYTEPLPEWQAPGTPPVPPRSFSGNAHPPSAPLAGQSLVGYPAMTDLKASGSGGGGMPLVPDEKGWQGFYPDDPLKKKALNNFFLDLAVQPTHGVGGLMRNVAKAAKSTQKYYENLVDKQTASQVAGAKAQLEARKVKAQTAKWVAEAVDAGTTGFLKEFKHSRDLIGSADPKKQKLGYELAADLSAKSGQMSKAQMYADMADKLWGYPEEARQAAEMSIKEMKKDIARLELDVAAEAKDKDIRNIQDVGGIKIIKR